MKRVREIYRSQGFFLPEQEGLIRLVVDRGFTVKWNAGRTVAYVIEWER